MIGGKQPMEMQFARENAHSRARRRGVVAWSISACKRDCVVGVSSKISTAHCQYRYPSPSRFGPPRTKPASLFRAWSRRFGQHTKNFVVFDVQTADSAPNSNTNKGSNLCLNSVFSSPRLRLFHSPHVLITMSNVALQAPQLALLSPMQRAATRPQVRLSVPVQACSATTQASAANPSRPSGRLTKIDRRWCRRAPAAVLHSKDRFPCSRKS